MRFRLRLGTITAILVALSGTAAVAGGTPSGTTITNTVTLDYTVGGVNQPQVSTSATFVVDTKIDLTVTKNAEDPIFRRLHHPRHARAPPALLSRLRLRGAPLQIPE